MTKNKNMIIIDTGFFVALGDLTDQYHERALGKLDELSDKKWITTWPVLTEVCHLLSRESPDLVPKFLQNLDEGAFEVFQLTKENVKRLKELIHQYRDLPMDLADASLVVLAEFLGHGNIVSTDMRDFKTYRFKNHRPFHNLFL